MAVETKKSGSIDDLIMEKAGFDSPDLVIQPGDAVFPGTYSDLQNYDIVYAARPKGMQAKPYSGYPNKAEQEFFVWLPINPGVVDRDRTPGAYGVTYVESGRIELDTKNLQGDMGQELETVTH